MYILNSRVFVTINLLILCLLSTSLMSNKPPGYDKIKANSSELELRSNCSPGVSEIDQQINNVRARLSTGGDVWWDRNDGLYIVPKPSEGQLPVSAIFAGGVWVGGIDRSGNKKLAGVTYRSLTSNFDWYPGPLDEEGATKSEDCKSWDRMFTVYATDISIHNIAFENAKAAGTPYNCDSIPNNVKYWPGKGNPYWRERFDFNLPDQSLGAFWDENEDGIYDPCDGDFPNIEIRNCGPENRSKAKELVPDEMIFWIYNDNGGPHRLTAGSAIRMEVQVQAFGYTTNDEVNDMTFQRYKLINKANEDLVDCYFAMWVDPDLGCYTDDYVGCDVERSLAYIYNEDAVDGQVGATCPDGINTYGSNVPALGIDYFRGPRGPKVFVRNPQTNAIILDASGNPVLRDPIPQTGEIDTLVELGMTSFVYTNNAGINSPPQATTDPQARDDEFYNNLRGLWKTGDPVTFGGSGFNPGSTDTVRYAFPSDPNNPTGWSMCTANLPNGDRRTLQSTGPLLLQPGATNELIIGVVFAPDLDYPCPDLSRLFNADDIAQALFNNCFDITDGPDAPDVCGVELDKEIILALTNDARASNNAFTAYQEVDLKAPETVTDNLYRFEGYKVYQLADGSVSPQELGDINKARLIFQTDVKNGVAEVFNWKSEPNPLPTNANQPVWSYTRMVQGADVGLNNTFKILEDQFAKGNRQLVNHKPYHFMAIAYAYNNFEDFDPREVLGQRTPYLEGRRNVKVYTFTPRPPVFVNLQSKYGDGVEVTRLDGEGSGGYFLDLKEGIAESIIRGEPNVKVVYKDGGAPIQVKIFNPLEVSDGKYRLEMEGGFNSASSICGLNTGVTWKLTEINTGEVIASESSIDKINEQIIYRKGFSIRIGQVKEPGNDIKGTNGAVGQTLTYKESGKQWLNAVTQNSRPNILGLPSSVFDALEPSVESDPTKYVDPNRRLGNMGTGTFFPFNMARFSNPPSDQFPFYLSTAWRDANQHSFLLNTRLGNLRIKDLNNVNIVFTPNKDLWSRCIVVETSTPDYYNAALAPTVGNSKNLEIRNQTSVDKDGNPQPSEPTGLGWFPGYAIDVETGERLNIFFGENSSFTGANARFLEGNNIAGDMLFNPSGQVVGTGNGPLPMLVPLGGQHFVYVTRQKYDGCAQLRNGLRNGSLFTSKIDPLSLVTWSAMIYGSTTTPMLPVSQGLIPNEATVKLRVERPFNRDRVITTTASQKSCNVVGGLPAYEFELTGKGIQELQQEEYVGALAKVNVVPNPYYAYSAYETNQFSNTIKITNLPERAVVTIFTLDGKFVRKFDREDRSRIKTGSNPANNRSQNNPALEWDLKNAVGIPVSSGVYLIHVVAPELGEERTLKWFGVNRKFDPTGL
jgi:hypothetical protein